MTDIDHLRAGLNAAVRDGPGGSAAADRLCLACVRLLDIDGAALCLSYEDGFSGRAFGSSSPLARELQELQFTLGEGPYLDAVSTGSTVMVSMDGRNAERWPGFSGAAMQRGVRAVLAVPVSMVHLQLGALDIYRTRGEDFDAATVIGASIAAELATVPLLSVMGTESDAAEATEPHNTWEYTALSRVEVYQASGMLMSQLHVRAAEAVVRLRGHAFAHDMTASAVAWEIIERRLRLDSDRNNQLTDEDEVP